MTLTADFDHKANIRPSMPAPTHAGHRGGHVHQAGVTGVACEAPGVATRVRVPAGAGEGKVGAPACVHGQERGPVRGAEAMKPAACSNPAAGIVNAAITAATNSIVYAVRGGGAKVGV